MKYLLKKARLINFDDGKDLIFKQYYSVRVFRNGRIKHCYISLYEANTIKEAVRFFIKNYYKKNDIILTVSLVGYTKYQLDEYSKCC